MRTLRRIASRIGLAVLIGFSGLLFGAHHAALAQTKYLPDAPLVPTIKNTLGPSGALGLPPLRPPPPKGFDKQSIWNMKIVGFADDLGCSNSDEMWVEHQGGREILYAGAGTGTVRNPLTKRDEPCGVRIYDVTNAARPKLLYQIPGDAAGDGAPHVFVCSGNTLPHATKGHYYLLTHRGSAKKSQGRQEIWDVTNPSAPSLLTTIVSGLDEFHRSYWECDTGVAYLIAGAKSDGWH
ncbi:MAG: hypothetical protein ACREFQ_03925, partial [Stellaceae bacterium]